MKSFYIISMLATAIAANEYTPEFVTKSEAEVAQVETEESVVEEEDRSRRLGWGGSSWSSSSDSCDPIIKYIYISVPQWGGGWGGSSWGGGSWSGGSWGGSDGHWAKVPVDDDDWSNDWDDNWSNDWDDDWSYSGKSGKGSYSGYGKSGKGSYGKSGKGSYGKSGKGTYGGKSNKSGGYWAKVPTGSSWGDAFGGW